MLAKRTTASAIFAGIGGTPVIADGVVYAASSNGLLAATELTKGRRLWEQEISSDNMPWVAGDYVFVLTTSDALLALSRIDGRIKWIQQLQQYEDEEEKRQPLSWRGPVLAGGHLWVVGRHGVMLSINPETGATVKQYDVPDEVVLAPIVGNGTLYLLTRDATLYAYK